MSDTAFGLWLKQRRRALDLTQEQLGERIGYATATIRKFEAGERRPSRDLAERLAEALELAPAEHASFVRSARGVADPPEARAVPEATPAPAVAASASWHSSLPKPATPFVGRAAELDQLGSMLSDPQCRMISVTGPGGTGKTRLAIQAAAANARSFAGGVAFVPLSAVASPDLLAPAIADALGFSLYGADMSQAQLLRHLRDQELLLVLDNMEHLVDAADLLAAILEQAPSLKLLVTSRERLRLQGEWQFQLQGLAVPAAEAGGRVDETGAVALFMQQARRSRADFTLAEGDYALVAQICRALEGIPLAIELAAAWVRVLSCAEIAQEIARSLDFLSAPMRGLPARHHSLRAVFDHSWNLLDDDERRVLRRLAVLRGGFSRAAAAAVSADPAPHAAQLLATLAALLDKSLLSRGADGRYDMHELVRQYAEEQLKADPAEDAATRDRHCTFFALQLQQHEDALRGAAQKAAVLEIGAEIDNLRVAGAWAMAQGRVADIRRAIRALGWFYEVRGWLHEGARMFEQLAKGLAARPSEPDQMIALGQALSYQGWFSFHLGQVGAAKALLRESIGLLRDGDAPLALADALAFSGFVSLVGGEYADARRLLQEGQSLSAAAGDSWTAGFCQGDLGMIAYQMGEYAEARRLLRAGISAARTVGDPRVLMYIVASYSLVCVALGEYREPQMLLQEALAAGVGQYDPWSLASALEQLGLLAFAQGDYAEADYLFRESIALFREIDDRRHVALALIYLGHSSAACRQSELARECYDEALTIAIGAQTPPLMLEALAGLAGLHAEQGAREPALELLACIQAHPAAGAHVRARAEQLSTQLAAELSPQRAAAAQQRGRALSLEAAIERERAPLPLSLDSLVVGRLYVLQS